MDRATHLEHLEHLRADSAALLTAYTAAPAAPVLSCPGWDRTALLGHTGRVHSWMRKQLAAGPGERVRLRDAEAAPDDAAVAAWFEQGAADLAEALAAMDVDLTWPTWAGPQPGTFYPRRAAQETVMHRWDAEPHSIDAALALDGVDEHLELFAPRLPADVLGETTGSIHLHATDVEGEAGEWLVRLTDGGIEFDHGHVKGDVALRGRASDLLLWIWNRVPVDERFEVHGDEGLLELWRRAVVF